MVPTALVLRSNSNLQHHSFASPHSVVEEVTEYGYRPTNGSIHLVLSVKIRSPYPSESSHIGFRQSVSDSYVVRHKHLLDA